MKWRGVEGNIPKLFALQMAKWFMLYMPIIAVFYMENGLTVGDIMLVQGVYSMTMALAEIPSGYFSDSLGRRKSLIVGMLLNFLGITFLSQAFGFWAILSSAIVIGLGSSFVSGTNSALLYDSLLSLKKESTYLKLQGRIYSAGTFSEAIAAIFGGWLAQFAGLRATVYGNIGIAFIGVLVAFSLIEVTIEKGKNSKQGWEHIVQILRYSLFENKKLRWFIFLSAAIGSATLTTAWFAQPFLKDQGVEPGWMGLIWSALNITVALVSFEAYRVYQVAKPRAIAIGLTAGIAFSFVGVSMVYSIWGVVFIFFIYVLRGIATPVLLDFVNKITPSDMRATVLSLRGLMIRVLFAIVAPFMGWVSDVYTIQQAFLVAGVTFLLLGSIAIIALFYTRESDLPSSI